MIQELEIPPENIRKPGLRQVGYDGLIYELELLHNVWLWKPIDLYKEAYRAYCDRVTQIEQWAHENG